MNPYTMLKSQYFTTTTLVGKNVTNFKPDYQETKYFKQSWNSEKNNT